MKKFNLLAILAGLAILFGCKSESSDDHKNQEVSSGTKQATLVEMFVPEVDAGDSENIYIHFEPKDSSVAVYCDTELADFDGNTVKVEEKGDGKWCTVPFKTKAAGSFTFYAKSGDKEWSSKVTVNPVINSLEIKGSKNSLDEKESLSLSAVTAPSLAASAITWRSSNPEVATVDANGLVTAVKSGTATITASTKKKPNNVSDNTQVSATFDITVKGFYLNGIAYYLYTKVSEYKDIAKATTTGYSDYTIEWISSDENLFKAVPVEGRDEAALEYVSNASGEGTLTAILKKKSDGSKLAETSAIVRVVRFEMIALGDSIAAGYAAPKLGGQYGKDEELEEADFLEAYNKYVKCRSEGSTDYDYVNEFAHPAVIGKDYNSKYNIRVRSYAKSGDQTGDLIKKLGEDFEDATLGTRKGEIYDAVKNAQIITLCIGANDILHHAMGINIVTKSTADFEKLLSDSFESFKGNFDSILTKLTGNTQQVYVMSIYNPYQYFDSTHIPANQVNAEELFGFVKTQKILEIIPVAIRYLNQMNAYIKEKAESDTYKEKVTFVDVADCFNKIPSEEHSKYVNVNPGKFSLQGLVCTFGKKIPVWFDPHPRKLGQDKIAKLFEAKLDE